jgi:two-component system, OmpR family, sensor kinase
VNRGLTDTELALLAHELRGALTVVVGLNDLLRAGLPADRRVVALEGIDRAVTRANALIASALDGTIAVPARILETVDVAALATEIVAEQQAISGREVSITVDSRPIVSGDPLALGRALGNLIDNALKYSLSSHPVEVTVHAEGDFAVIEVADRGCGISDEQSEAAFEPFERLGRDDTTPGTGLGLAVVRSVAEGLGGTASVAPRNGGGTIARIELPISASDAAS